MLRWLIDAEGMCFFSSGADAVCVSEVSVAQWTKAEAAGLLIQRFRVRVPAEMVTWQGTSFILYAVMLG